MKHTSGPCTVPEGGSLRGGRERGERPNRVSNQHWGFIRKLQRKVVDDVSPQLGPICHVSRLVGVPEAQEVHCVHPVVVRQLGHQVAEVARAPTCEHGTVQPNNSTDNSVSMTSRFPKSYRTIV